MNVIQSFTEQLVAMPDNLEIQEKLDHVIADLFGLDAENLHDIAMPIDD